MAICQIYLLEVNNMSGIQHPEITWIERTGYPSRMQEDDDYDQNYYDDCSDSLYEERRDESLFGDK